jgi:uncharacterized protein (TIGR02996 family)
MTSENAFLRAIWEEPGDAARLVYADWLEERGDPRFFSKESSTPGQQIPAAGRSAGTTIM